MRVRFEQDFLTYLERIDNKVMIDECRVGTSSYRPEVVYYDDLIRACIIGVEEDVCEKLEFYTSSGNLAFTILGDGDIKLNPERTIFEIILPTTPKAEIGCSWLTNDTKFIESPGINLGSSFYKDIRVSEDSLVWKESVEKYVTERGLENHVFSTEKLDTKSGEIYDRPVKFKSYQNIKIYQGNWDVDSIERAIVTKHDVYSEISSSNFLVWDSPMIDAKVDFNSDPTCINNIGKYVDPGNVIFGNTDCFQFINFQNLKGFRLTGTEGSSIEVLFNKASTEGRYITYSVDIDSSGVAEVRIPEDLQYYHLNGIIASGPAKVDKIETILYIEESVNVITPNPDNTYVINIANIDPSSVVKIYGTCDYIEYEKYLGKITKIGEGTDSINSVPGLEILTVESGGLNYKIDSLEKQIKCFYNNSVSGVDLYGIFQVVIRDNIEVEVDTISTSILSSDYKIKIIQSGTIWKIATLSDYIYETEDEKEYGVYVFDYNYPQTKRIKVLVNRTDYTGKLTISSTGTYNTLSSIFNFTSNDNAVTELIDGEYWNVFYIDVKTISNNSGNDWRPKNGNDPYVVDFIKYQGVSIPINFCVIQRIRIEPVLEIWEETLPGIFSRVGDTGINIFNSLSKTFIVVKNGTDTEESINWYYYDLSSTNKFYITDTESMVTNVGLIFINEDPNKETINLGGSTSELRNKFGRVINVNRSDYIDALGVLTVTESSTYPGSWRDLLNQNTINVNVYRYLTNIYIQVGTTNDNLEDEDMSLGVSKIGVYDLKIRSNFKYLALTNSEGYLHFIDKSGSGVVFSDKKTVFSGYNSITTFKLVITNLDDLGGIEKSYVEINSGSVTRKITLDINNLEVTHNYKNSSPDRIRVLNNGTTTKSEVFEYTSSTTPSISFVDIDKSNVTTDTIFSGSSQSNLSYVDHKSSLTINVPNPQSLSLTKYPIKSFGSIREQSLSYSGEEMTRYLEYLFYMKGKEHHLWCLDNINDLSGISDNDIPTDVDVVLDAAGESGRNFYIVSRYGINNNTFITEYPQDSEVKISRGELEAKLTVSPQEKITLDKTSQIEYAIPIKIECNTLNNNGNVFLGSFQFKAKTVITEGSLTDVIDVSSDVAAAEMGTTSASIVNYIKTYIVGESEQDLNINVFQRGSDANALDLINPDLHDFSVEEDTQYLISSIGDNITLVGNPTVILTENGGGDLSGCTYECISSSKYFYIKIHSDNRIEENETHWFNPFTYNEFVNTVYNGDYSLNVSVNYKKAGDSTTYTKQFSSIHFLRYGFNNCLYVKDPISGKSWYGFGNAESEKNKKSINTIEISADGGNVLINAGVFYANISYPNPGGSATADSWMWETQALDVPYEYKFIGENKPEEVTWEGGNRDGGGNLYIKIPPRLRDDYGPKHFILQVTQPNEYYPLNLYIDFVQKSLRGDSPDTSKTNYKLLFNKSRLNIYSDGKFEDDDNKIYFTHNLTEEIFKDVTFIWDPVKGSGDSDIPTSPDDLSILEELERSYKDGYIRLKFKPNGSNTFIKHNLVARYNGMTIGKIPVRMGYFNLSLQFYSTNGTVSPPVNYISRINPTRLVLGKASTSSSTYIIYNSQSPCLTQSDNSNSSSNISGRTIYKLVAKRREFSESSEVTYGKDAGNLSNIYKSSELISISNPDYFESTGVSTMLSFESGEGEYYQSDPDATLNETFNGRKLYTEHNFTDDIPYLEITYKSKEEYLRERFLFTSQCKITLFNEATNKTVDYYFVTSQYKSKSNEPLNVELLQFSDQSLKFDCKGGTKQVSFYPEYFGSLFSHGFIPGGVISWVTASVSNNAIQFVVDSNQSEEEGTFTNSRSVQYKIDVLDPRQTTSEVPVILKTFYIDIEQGSDNVGGKSPEPPGPEPPTPQPSVDLDEQLNNVWNPKFFNANLPNYQMDGPITQNSTVYPYIAEAANYYDSQFDLIENSGSGDYTGWADIFEDEIEVSDSYEITHIGVDKAAGFGWFLAFLFNYLYPFRGQSMSYKFRNDIIYEIAFENYCEVYRVKPDVISENDYDYSSIDGTKFLQKYAGTLAASIIFAKMMSNPTMRTMFDDLKKNKKYTSNGVTEFYYNDGEKFLRPGDDGICYEAECFFPLPPKNNSNNWVLTRDMLYHNKGGMVRGSQNTIGNVALQDRSQSINRFLTIYGGLDYSNSNVKSIHIKVPTGTITKNVLSWQEAENSTGGYTPNYKGFSSSVLGYQWSRSSTLGYPRYCLLDLSRHVGDCMASRIKNKSLHTDTAPTGAKVYIFRERPYSYIQSAFGTEHVDNRSGSDGLGGYNPNSTPPMYYYDNTGSSSVTSTLTDSSYPSGHTGVGWNMAMVYCTAFSEFSDDNNLADLKLLFRRAYQYCEHRVILGAHWQQCVDIGRIASACCFAMACANGYFIEQIGFAQGENT